MNRLLILNTYIKIAFSDWLYVLIYDLGTENGLKIDASEKRLFLFDECRKARFRFENKSLYSDEVINDLKYQYGNYHLSEINFNENFKTIPNQILKDSLKDFITRKVHPSVTATEKEKAIKITNDTIKKLVAPGDDTYELDVEDEKTIATTAPFATFDFFKSYLVFKSDNSKLCYVELGSD